MAEPYVIPLLYRKVAHYGYKGNNLSYIHQYLIVHKNVNQAIEGGWTPLHLAAGLNRPELVSLLLEYGADPEQRNNLGVSPLMHAVAWQSDKVLPLLLQKSTVHHKDAQGRSLLFVAVLSWEQRCAIQECFEQAPDLHTEDPQYVSHTPFIDLLSRCPYAPILNLLFEHGAHLYELANTGKSPYQIAQEAAYCRSPVALKALHKEQERRNEILSRMRAFLLAQHVRLGAPSPAHVLPAQIVQDIFELLRVGERFLRC